MLLRFLHYLGFALWGGGGWTTMALLMRSRKDSPAAMTTLYRLLPAAYAVMATGAAITVLSGIALSIWLSHLGLGVRLQQPGIMVMQGAGIIAALMILGIGAPASRKLARLAAMNPLPPEFERLRKRQAIGASVTGALVLIALVGATLA